MKRKYQLSNKGFSNKISNILFLRGLKLSDITSIEDVFDDTIMQNIIDHSANSSPITYKANPVIFIDKSHWPQKSNCLCWMCSSKFDSIPIPIPINMSKMLKKDLPEYFKDLDGDYESESIEVINLVKGSNCCSINCAQKWINIYCRNDGTHDDRTKLLKIIYKKLYNKYIGKIVESPDHTQQRQYSGEYGISPQEYRNKIKEINEEYALHEYKLEHLIPNKY